MSAAPGPRPTPTPDPEAEGGERTLEFEGVLPTADPPGPFRDGPPSTATGSGAGPVAAEGGEDTEPFGDVLPPAGPAPAAAATAPTGADPRPATPPPPSPRAETLPPPDAPPEATERFDYVLGAPDQETVDPPARAGEREPTEPFEAVIPAPPDVELTGPFGGVLPVPQGGAAAPARPAPSPPSGEDAPAPGAEVGGFRLSGVLREDATGTLFAAEHPQEGACVVRLLGPAAARALGSDYLLAARQRTTLLDPRLARVVGFGGEPRPWVALDRLRGPTLREALGDGPLSPSRLARILVEVARGLAHAHARRTAHGDLRPEDVFLDDPERPVVSGFGPPRPAGPGGERLAYAGGPALGPAPYQPPEWLGGERPGARADVYALGAILVEGLTGRPPARGAPPPVAALPPAAAPLGPVVTGCLAAAPEARYPSAQEVAVALHQALDALPRSGGFLRRLARRLRRR